MKRKYAFFLALALLVGLLAWQLWTTPKNMDNIPSFAVMEAQGPDWSQERLKGYHADQLHDIWGQPDGSLFGFWADIWETESGTAIYVYYDADGKVETVKFSQAAEASSQVQISAVHTDGTYTSLEFPQGQEESSPIGYAAIGLSDVVILLDGTAVELEKALSEGRISLGQLLAWAQADAEAGFCEERWESENGLARFCYAYPDLDLWIIHDIYETPDGAQHRIRQITLSQPGSDVISLYPELDQEDWSIALSVLEAASDSITLSYAQSGGQLLGQLVTSSYEISRLEPREAILPLPNSPAQAQFPISQNTQGTITLDIESHFGDLPAGEYGMYLYLQDVYDPETVPSLMRNFHDIQCYWLEFSVPQ